MKHINFKLISKLVFTFAVTLLCLWLCLVLSAAIPNQHIKANMIKSAEAFGKTDAYSFKNGSKVNSISDNYADSILLNISYNMGRGNPIESSINTRYHNGGEYGENYGLYITVIDDKAPNTDYTRYFHGSAAFVRLYHLFTDVSGMRLISFCIICAMVLFTLALLIHKRYYFVAASLLISLAAVQFYNIRFSLEYQSAFAVCFALCPLWLLFEEKYNNAPIFLSCISGVMIAFFDFLTTETVTILLPLVMVIAIRAREDRIGTWGELVRFVIACLASWVISYIMTFAVKWLLASAVTGAGVINAALGSVAQRFAGDIHDYSDTPDNVFSSIFANLAMPFGAHERSAYMLAAVGWALFLLVIFSVWYLLRSKKSETKASLVMISLGLCTIVRFFVLNNHSWLHCFFTYRALCSLVFALLLALWLNIGHSRKRVGR